MIVVKHSLNTKASGLLRDPSNFTDAFDPKILAALIGRGNQDFDSNLRAEGWTIRAEDQRTIPGNIVREAALRVLFPVIPVENDRESQLVSNCGAALENGLNDLEKMHT